MGYWKNGLVVLVAGVGGCGPGSSEPGSESTSMEAGSDDGGGGDGGDETESGDDDSDGGGDSGGSESANDDTDDGGDDDDDDSSDCKCAPPDEPAPQGYESHGGTVSVQVEGPGPWDGAPSASFEWTKEHSFNDSEGMFCRLGGGEGYSMSSFDFITNQDPVIGFGFIIDIPDFEAPGSHVFDATTEGHVLFEMYLDGLEDLTSGAASASSSVGGTCMVEVDPLSWTGTGSCTGLLDDSDPELEVEVGPLDLTFSWQCSVNGSFNCTPADCGE